MKTFLKKNLIWAFALVLGIGTMSFKLIEQNKPLAGDWYPVQPGGVNITSTPDPNAPNVCRGSIEDCAIQIEIVVPGTPFPSTVDQAENLEAEEKLIIHDRKQRF